MNASIRAVLEVQTVNRFPVVPCNLTRYHLHFGYQTRPEEGKKKHVKCDAPGRFKLAYRSSAANIECYLYIQMDAVLGNTKH